MLAILLELERARELLDGCRRLRMDVSRDARQILPVILTDVGHERAHLWCGRTETEMRRTVFATQQSPSPQRVESFQGALVARVVAGRHVAHQPGAVLLLVHHEKRLQLRHVVDVVADEAPDFLRNVVGRCHAAAAATRTSASAPTKRSCHALMQLRRSAESMVWWRSRRSPSGMFSAC